MRGLFGIVHEGDGGEPRDAFERMCFAARGPHAGPRAEWCDRGACFGVIGTADDAAGAAALSDDRGLDAQVRLAAARLDNSRDLLVAPHDPAAPGNDDARVLIGWHRAHGDAGLGRAYGDWSFAAWAPRQQRLTLARDHCGISTICYVQSSRFFAFAPSARPLLALPHVSKAPDELAIARALTTVPADGTSTAYRGVSRLPPGHKLVYEGGRVSLTRYWRPEEAPTLDWTRDEDYADALLDLLDRAVRARLTPRTTVAVLLSSGLDSGAVCALAGPAVREDGGETVALTAVPAGPHVAPHGCTGDEWPLASKTARMAGVTRHVPIDAAGASYVACIEGLQPALTTPPSLGANTLWLDESLRRARAAGARALLVGQAGNATASWNGTPSVWPLLRRGTWTHAARRLGGFARALGPKGMHRAVRQAVVRPVITPARSAWTRWRSSPRPWERYSAIHPDFAERLDLGRLMHEAGHDPYFLSARPTRARRVGLVRSGAAGAGSTWHALSCHYGVDVRDPTIDARLIEFCLRVPDDQWWATGHRSLIRRAMRGRLPDEVLRMTPRGVQSADRGYRVAAQRAEISAALGRLRRSPHASEILDVPRMSSVLDSVSNGVTLENTRDTGVILLRGLAVGLFLEQFD